VNIAKPKTITKWPPPEPIRQVTRQELKEMSPQAVNEAREAGALADLMAGKGE
jgi:hypothetical protein